MSRQQYPLSMKKTLNTSGQLTTTALYHHQLLYWLSEGTQRWSKMHCWLWCEECVVTFLQHFDVILSTMGTRDIYTWLSHCTPVLRCPGRDCKHCHYNYEASFTNLNITEVSSMSWCNVTPPLLLYQLSKLKYSPLQDYICEPNKLKYFDTWHGHIFVTQLWQEMSSVTRWLWGNIVVTILSRHCHTTRPRWCVQMRNHIWSLRKLFYQITRSPIPGNPIHFDVHSNLDACIG